MQIVGIPSSFLQELCSCHKRFFYWGHFVIIGGGAFTKGGLRAGLKNDTLGQDMNTGFPPWWSRGTLHTLKLLVGLLLAPGGDKGHKISLFPWQIEEFSIGGYLSWRERNIWVPEPGKQNLQVGLSLGISNNFFEDFKTNYYLPRNMFWKTEHMLRCWKGRR